MEQLLHYTWKHKMFPLRPLTTTDGRSVVVIDPGLHNLNAGSDFFNAKIKVGGTLWVGNIEIHDKASDWYRHGHDHDSNYDNVILHVVGVDDADTRNTKDQYITKLVLEVPQSVRDNYEELLATDSYPPCYRIIPDLSKLTVHSWMTALETERLQRKTTDIARRAQLKNGSWEDAYFVTLARNYGFGINGEVFEQWAQTLSLQAVGHHRDDLFQIEAIFMGQAGLLTLDAIPSYHQQEALNEGYFAKLKNEYEYLAHKFSLQSIDYKQWRFLRLRPQNFPHIRISQLAYLYHERKAGLSALLECRNVEQLKKLLTTQVTPYWQTHYGFGGVSSQSSKRLSEASLNLIIINTAIPMFFAYGRHTSNESLCELAFNMLEQVKAENNMIVRMWQQCGLAVENAGDSQALIQLKKEYCDKKDCLRCRIGYEYLKRQHS